MLDCPKASVSVAGVPLYFDQTSKSEKINNLKQSKVAKTSPKKEKKASGCCAKLNLAASQCVA